VRPRILDQEGKMSTTIAAVDSQAEILPIPGAVLYRLSAEQYEAMGRAGILTEHDRVELIQGLLVTKMTRNPPQFTVLEESETAAIVIDGREVGEILVGDLLP